MFSRISFVIRQLDRLMKWEEASRYRNHLSKIDQHQIWKFAEDIILWLSSGYLLDSCCLFKGKSNHRSFLWVTFFDDNATHSLSFGCSKSLTSLFSIENKSRKELHLLNFIIAFNVIVERLTLLTDVRNQWVLILKTWEYTAEEHTLQYETKTRTECLTANDDGQSQPEFQTAICTYVECTYYFWTVLWGLSPGYDLRLGKKMIVDKKLVSS